MGRYTDKKSILILTGTILLMIVLGAVIPVVIFEGLFHNQPYPEGRPDTPPAPEDCTMEEAGRIALINPTVSQEFGNSTLTVVGVQEMGGMSGELSFLVTLGNSIPTGGSGSTEVIVLVRHDGSVAGIFPASSAER